MKWRFTISGLSIGRQVMFTALLPLLLLTLALSSYLISSRIQDAQTALDDQADTLLEFISAASEFGLLTQNIEILEQLTRGPTKRPEVSNIMFVNPKLQLLYQSEVLDIDVSRVLSAGQLNPVGKRVALEGIEHSWVLVKPVMMSAMNVDDFDQSLAPERHIGTVILIVNDEQLLQQQQQIVLWGLLISGLGLLVAVFVAARIGRNISRPIEALSQSLTQYQSGGSYQPAITGSFQQEIGALQQGVVALITQVQQHQQQLQSKVDLATAELQTALSELELSHQHLQQSKDQAELSGRAKDDFMARMSHELRTPISSVIGFVQLLEKSRLSDSQREYCRIIHGASSLLLRLIDDILYFSKFQSDNLKLENIPFSPEQCLEDVLEMQAPAAGFKGLKLGLHCESPWPLVVMGDPTRFSQVISNLISNAIKFTEQGGVQVRLSSQQQEGRTRLQIEIQDSGIGIAASELATLFQPFSQADTSISRRFGGSGLGLVISKRLVELMQGELTLTSVVGEGSQFSIGLSFEHGPAPEPKSLPALKVLLCYSDRQCLDSFEQQFLAWNCSVESVEDRQQLLPHIQASAQAYDRVIVYLSLEELKALSWNRFLNPVRECFSGELILITDHGDEELGANTDQLVASLAPATLLRLPVGRYRLFNALEARPLPNAPVTLSDLSLQGLTILVVEDNRFNRLMLTRMLQAQGALVEATANGRDAVAVTEQKAVDLILMDLHMPIMGGADASRKIRQLPSSAAKTPILLLTADVISDESELIASLGLQGVLYKPVDELVLVKEILSALHSNEQALVSKSVTSDVAMRLQQFGIPEEELQKALEEQFAALQQALLVGDRLELREQAHQLSGLAAMVGLTQLEVQIRAFSSAVKRNQMDEAWQFYWGIKEDFDKSNSIYDMS
jgi:two-component system sensor histidine kinase BarA